MFYFENSNPDQLYRDVLEAILKKGTMTQPRGFKCLELSPAMVCLSSPAANIILNPVRKINKGFAAAELLWMLTGRNDVGFISYYNSQIAKFSDDGHTFYGAYGPKIIEQMPYIQHILKTDPWTRQAVVSIWRESPPSSKDIPCTVTFHFIRRPLDKLNMHVYMRSQDCWLGFPYDLHNFTSIQMMVASMLQIEAGKFYLQQGSLHAYQENFVEMEKTVHAFDHDKSWQFQLQLTKKPTCDGNCLNKEWNVAVAQVDKLIQAPEINLGAIREVIDALKDEFLKQKLGWMLDHGIKKRALLLHPPH